MLKIPRLLQNTIAKQLEIGSKAILLYGPRQAGKTTLIKDILKELPYRALEINADEGRYIDVLSSRDASKLSELVEGYELLFIDEAQRIPEIGLGLKIITDQLPELRLIATGSSSLELAAGTAEPLTGRKWTYLLLPIAQLELREIHNKFELEQQIESRLRWGSYPEIFNLPTAEAKAKYLRELSNDYLYKDVLALTDIRSSDKIRALLKLLAFQIGSEVSLNELGNSLDMSKDTVARYIDLLEKSYVLIKLSGFSRNLRKEIAKKNKYYFCDLGVRNALIDNFSQLSSRSDNGQLWENFLVIERFKRNIYCDWIGKGYFWRTYTGAEIDYVEESEGRLHGFEIKYGQTKSRKPETFLKEYQGSQWQIVNQDNWLDFVLKE